MAVGNAFKLLSVLDRPNRTNTAAIDAHFNGAVRGLSCVLLQQSGLAQTPFREGRSRTVTFGALCSLLKKVNGGETPRS